MYWLVYETMDMFCNLIKKNIIDLLKFLEVFATICASFKIKSTILKLDCEICRNNIWMMVSYTILI